MKNVLLVDVDSTIPNIALMQISSWQKSVGNNVDFIRCNISYYPRFKKHVTVDNSKYDEVYVSTIFKNCLEYIKFSRSDNLIIVGTGHDLKTEIPFQALGYELDYSLYPDNDISYGFISRGCNRDCYFCVVPEKEGKVKYSSKLESIIKHKRVKFLDNNFLQYDKHKEVLQELIDKSIRCQFMQGLDLRMLDEENAKLLGNLNYLGEYIFAFDDYKYVRTIGKKLELLSWRKDWQIKFYVYTHPDMQDFEIVQRIEWLRENKCLPYIMRDLECFNSKKKYFYTDLAAYCNQPAFFKKISFEEFLHKRHKSKKAIQRVTDSIFLYNEAKNTKPPKIFELHYLNK